MADKTKYFDYDTVKEMLYDLEYEGKDVEPSDYPFIEIADEHGDLIDKQKLIKELEKAWNVDDDQDFCNKSVWRIIERESEVVLEGST